MEISSIFVRISFSMQNIEKKLMIVIEVGAGAPAADVALLTASVTLMVLQVLAGSREVRTGSVSLLPGLVRADESLTDVAPSLSLTLVDGVTSLHALSTLLVLEASVGQVTQLLTDSALGGLTDLSLVAVVLAVGAEPALISLVTHLVAAIALGSATVVLSVTVFLAALTEPAVLGSVTELVAVLALLSLTLLLDMTLGSAATAWDGGTVLDEVALLFAVSTSAFDLDLTVSALRYRVLESPGLRHFIPCYREC